MRSLLKLQPTTSWGTLHSWLRCKHPMTYLPNVAASCSLKLLLIVPPTYWYSNSEYSSCRLNIVDILLCPFAVLRSRTTGCRFQLNVLDCTIAKFLSHFAAPTYRFPERGLLFACPINQTIEACSRTEGREDEDTKNIPKILSRTTVLAEEPQKIEKPYDGMGLSTF